jgi:hypothetical protein
MRNRWAKSLCDMGPTPFFETQLLHRPIQSSENAIDRPRRARPISLASPMMLKMGRRQ